MMMVPEESKDAQSKNYSNERRIWELLQANDAHIAEKDQLKQIIEANNEQLAWYRKRVTRLEQQLQGICDPELDQKKQAQVTSDDPSLKIDRNGESAQPSQLLEEIKEYVEETKIALKNLKPKEKNKWQIKDEKLLKLYPWAPEVDETEVLVNAEWFDMSKVEADPIPNLLTKTKSTRKSTIRCCLTCWKVFENKGELRQHMQEKHEATKLFCDLDSEQQERALRVHEIYSKISLTHKSFNDGNHIKYSKEEMS